MASIRIRERIGKPPVHAVLWRDPETRRQTSMTFDEHQDAVNFKRFIEANGGNMDATVEVLDAIAKRSPTVRVVMAEHIAGLSAVNARTRADYRREADRHILPLLGRIPVNELTPDKVRGWVRALAKTDMADKSIANVHGLLSAALTTAVQAGYREGNPCRGIRLPRRNDHEAVEMRCLTEAEWHTVDTELGTVLGGHFQLLFRVLAGTGMRWGEAAALRVGDFSLTTDPPTVRIVRAIKRDEKMQNYVGTTKSSKSKRTISITASLATQITEHTRGMGLSDPVFTMRTGAPLHPTNVRTRAWWPALIKAGITEPRPRIHDLRHTHASWLLGAGVDLFTVSRRLGHESILTTTSVYGHIQPVQQRAAADALRGIV